MKILSGDLLCDGCDKYKRRVVYIKSGAREMWLCGRCLDAIVALLRRVQEGL